MVWFQQLQWVFLSDSTSFCRMQILLLQIYLSTNFIMNSKKLINYYLVVLTTPYVVIYCPFGTHYSDHWWWQCYSYVQSMGAKRVCGCAKVCIVIEDFVLIIKCQYTFRFVYLRQIMSLLTYEQRSSCGPPLLELLCPNREMLLTFTDKYSNFPTLTSISGLSQVSSGGQNKVKLWLL